MEQETERRIKNKDKRQTDDGKKRETIFRISKKLSDDWVLKQKAKYGNYKYIGI